MKIVVIRLSGRAYRDLRITTHVALVARAFGSQKIILDAASDPGIKNTVEKVTRQFGGDFCVEYETELLKRIEELQKQGYAVVHLTMYGEKPFSIVKKLKRNKKTKVAIIVGADKVPGKVYQLADYNVSITSQPHSEVAALAVFIHYLQGGKEEEIDFPHARKKIIPNSRGKTIQKNND
jgi:tRNA (cytidine56-2'-O)-methyltransferase